MERAQVELVVRHTLALVRRIAAQTRTHADDLLAAILEANGSRIAEAVLALAASPTPTDKEIVEALSGVGIKV